MSMQPVTAQVVKSHVPSVRSGSGKVHWKIEKVKPAPKKRGRPRKAK
jgi:hypothetical protein